MRSFLAVVVGFVAVVALSIGTDALLAYTLFPCLAHSEASTNVWLLIVGYCSVYSVIGGYLTARLAPNRPVGHAVVLGVIGLAVGLLGVFFGPRGAGPAWYPIAIAAQALPFSWLGGWISARGRAI
jgi:hypothetical protein